MRQMYGVEMQVPADKLPGFYAQVIHKIGDHVNVFDRDKLLFIVETKEERDKLEAVLAKPGMLGDVFTLLLLPKEARIEALDDVGFVSQNGHSYLYAERVALFTFTEDAGNEQDRWAARQQLQEHAIGYILAAPPSTPILLIDSSLTDLAEGIARAYRLRVAWLHRGE